MVNFRLNLDNPRETQVLETLLVLDEQGYSMRQIVTDTLLVFDGIISGYPKMLRVDEII
jgi:hypothetical protein